MKLTAVGAGPRHLLRALPFLLLGRRKASGPVENGSIACSASAIRLDMEGGFAVDGELYRAETRSGPVTIADGGTADFLCLRE